VRNVCVCVCVCVFVELSVTSEAASSLFKPKKENLAEAYMIAELP